MSQQRVHVPDASLPSAGSARALVPPFRRYYQGTATSCHPSRRASFPSHERYHDYARLISLPPPPSAQRQAWGWLPGIPFRVFPRGNDRISQVPGEPRFPFAHVLRPRPADASLTNSGTLARPPFMETSRAPTTRCFRGSIAWLSGWLPTLRSGGCPTPRKARFQMLVRLFWTGFYPQGSCRRFQILILFIFLLLQVSWRNPNLTPRPCAN